MKLLQQIDKHLLYNYVAFTVITLFTTLSILFYISVQNLQATFFPLSLWHIANYHNKPYQKGIITKDGGTLYIFTTQFSLDDILSIENPTLWLDESIIPAEVQLGSRPLSITHITKGHHQNTYLIAYKLPPSDISFTNTLTIHYTTGNMAGWYNIPQITPEAHVRKLILVKNILLFITSQATSLLSFIGMLILILVFLYTYHKHLLAFAEALFLIWILSTFGSGNYILYYFLPLSIGIIVIQQINYKYTSYIHQLLAVAFILTIVTIPILFSGYPHWYPLLRGLLSIIALVSLYKYFYKVKDEHISVIYWVFTVFTIITLESFFQIFTSPDKFLTTSSLLSSSITAILFAIIGIHTSFINQGTHPANLVNKLITEKRPFASVFIKSRALVKKSSTIEEVILPLLSISDAYTVTQSGIWLIRPNITPEEISIWSKKLISQLRSIEKIKDARIGILYVLPSRNINHLHPKTILKETIKASELATYPNFTYITQYPQP